MTQVAHGVIGVIASISETIFNCLVKIFLTTWQRGTMHSFFMCSPKKSRTIFNKFVAIINYGAWEKLKEFYLGG